MKKVVLALMAALAAVFGLSAPVGAYPPDGSDVTVSDSNPVAGGSTAITANCTGDETVTVTLGSETATDTCTNGTATVTISVPSTPGTVTGTVVGSISGSIGSFSVSVAESNLPSTGSNSSSSIIWIAAGLFIAGLGVFGVANVRRREDAATSVA